MNVESAIRMNIATGVNQTCGKLQMLRAKELDWDLMELTAHSGARPSHAEWQGKIVSLSGRSGYLSLDDIGYGEITGFKGVNCNHDWMPFYKGSTRTYTNEELGKMANETVTYNGEKISRYDAQELQRRMERQIRQDKKDIAGLQGILTSTTKDNELLEKTKLSLTNMQAKIKQHNTELNNFLRQTSLRKDYSRLKVGKIGVTKDVKNDIIKRKNKIFEKLKEAKIEYNPIKKLKEFLTEDEIIKKVGGGDTTKGSCSSVSLAYIANKNGFDVLDFRGGASQEFFSRMSNICEIAKIKGAKSRIEKNFNDIMGTMNLLKTVEAGKEYYLATGNHATIIKKVGSGYQYLELQSPKQNGFKALTTEILKKRFGCKQSHSVAGNKLRTKNILIEIESLKENNEFEEILGYINTSGNRQKKGVTGSER